MDSLVTLAIAVAIGLFFEPGWRLHPGARAAIEEEREQHEHHHAEHGEHGDASLEEIEGEGLPEQAKKNWLMQGRDAFEGLNQKAGTAINNAKEEVGPLAEKWAEWLRSPAGVEVAIPYALLSATWLLWWRKEAATKESTSRWIRPVSPLAPKLQIGDQSGSGVDDAMPTAAMIFFFGVGLGLALSRAAYRWSIAGQEEAIPPVVIMKTQGAVEAAAKKLGEAKKAPPAGTHLRTPDNSLKLGSRAGSKPSSKSGRKGDPDRHGGDEAAGSEDKDIEMAEDTKAQPHMPQEFSMWTPQTSWAAGAGDGSGRGDSKSGWTPQVSWGDATFTDVNPKHGG